MSVERERHTQQTNAELRKQLEEEKKPLMDAAKKAEDNTLKPSASIMSEKIDG